MDDEARVSFDADGRSVRVRDRLDGGVLNAELDGAADVRPALPDLFPYPVDRAVSLDAGSVRVDAGMAMLRGAGGDLIEYLREPTRVPVGDYLFELEGPVKAYLRVSDVGFSTNGIADDGRFVIEFDEPTTVTLGARSTHSRPEATIVVPDDPEAVMTAVSQFGSAIKEFSSERSWPTLRGHPPRIRRGDALDVPDVLEQPDTGLTVTVPPTYADVYRVAPLAYYLGARVEPGDEAALRLENGYAEPLRRDGEGLAERVAAILQRCLVLDSLTRTVGYTPSDRWEYDRIGGRLPFYPPSLYGESLSTQLMEYLEVDRSTVEPCVPRWPRTGVLRPDPADAELLPYLAYALSPVAVDGDAPAPRLVPDGVAGAVSGAGGPPNAAVGSDAGPGSVAGNGPLGGGDPPGASRLTATAYERGFELVRSQPGEASALLITSSAARAEALRAGVADRLEAGTYASASVLVDPAADRLRERLTDDVDVAVCDLPATEAGLRCGDGVVRFGDLDPLGPPALLLEGVASPAVPAALVRQGAVVAAYADSRLGVDPLASFLRLLGRGLSAAESASFVGLESAGLRYAGDPSQQIVGELEGAPSPVLDVTSRSPTRHDVRLRNVPSRRCLVGGEGLLFVDWADDRNYLLGADREDFPPISTGELRRLVDSDDTVVRINDRVVFGADDVDEADIRDCAEEALAGRSDG